MSDEVYEGAIGIDLGMLPPADDSASLHANASSQALRTLAWPTMRARMWKSVCPHLAHILGRAEEHSPHGITVANEQGSFTTPSFVSFTDEERLIGEAAKNQAAMNPENTIFDVKFVKRGPHASERRLICPQAIDWAKI